MGFQDKQNNDENRIVTGVSATNLKNGIKTVFLLKRGSKYPCEVISCLGTYESPHLLLLSGIGDAIDLENNLRIKCEVNNPNVGKHLKDHLLFGCIYSTSERKIGADHALNGFHGWCNYKIPEGKGKIQ